MVLLLAEQLEVPFRERNQMLLAAGHAPVFPERALEDPEMAPVREALDVILDGHEPYPAVVVDRGWNLVAANPTMAALAQGVDPALLEPPVNVMRLGLQPAAGWRPGSSTSARCRAYFVGRLERQVALSGDEDPGGAAGGGSRLPGAGLRARSRLRGGGGQHPHADDAAADPGRPELSFFFTVASFGTAVEVTASELSIELGFPADAATAEALKKLPRR